MENERNPTEKNFNSLVRLRISWIFPINFTNFSFLSSCQWVWWMLINWNAVIEVNKIVEFNPQLVQIQWANVMDWILPFLFIQQRPTHSETHSRKRFSFFHERNFNDGIRPSASPNEFPEFILNLRSANFNLPFEEFIAVQIKVAIGICV